ncbi:MAG: plasmid partitioning protein RepB C-terminal domain-containing protein [Pseudomonadota bacterium]
MKQKNRNAKIKMIPIERINILNPRARSQKVFLDISENITKVGLKRPITVTPSSSGDGKEYDLVCGQGRIEAFQTCSQAHIPAIVIDASEEEALIMSLVENLARRQHRSLDLLHGIEVLQQKGYDAKTIAKKTGLTNHYAKSVLDLLERGEERLLSAVEAGHLPVSVAVSIADSPDDEQQALQEAYENNELRGSKLKMAKRLLEVRKQRGKSIRQQKQKCGRSRKAGAISAQDVLKIYQKEVDRKRLLTRKADVVGSRMLFITEALRRLYAEDNFATLLKAEGLTTMPKQLSAMLEEK